MTTDKKFFNQKSTHPTIFIIAKFCGMALFGLLVGLMGKMINDWLLGNKK